MSDSVFIPDWDAPHAIKSLQTTRLGGYSPAPFEQFNLAEHVADDPVSVQQNRQQLATLLPSEPIWLNQVHSNILVNAQLTKRGCIADGSLTNQKKVVSVVMTADCLPILVCNQQATVVAALHAGWRGLAGGILEQGIQQLLTLGQCRVKDLMVWLGPAIGPQQFEVGEDVRQAFIQSSVNSLIVEQISQCFKPILSVDHQIKWLADLYQLARIKLTVLGIERCFGGNFCTYQQSDLFYSYRRDGQTGRMASLIWIE
jgi:YfiH family protein